MKGFTEKSENAALTVCAQPTALVHKPCPKALSVGAVQGHSPGEEGNTPTPQAPQIPC